MENASPGRIARRSASFKPLLALGDENDSKILIGSSQLGTGKALIFGHPALMYHAELLPRHLDWLGAEDGTTIWAARRVSGQLNNALGPYRGRVIVQVWEPPLADVAVKPHDILYFDPYRGVDDDDRTEALRLMRHAGCHVLLEMLGWVAIAYHKVAPEDLPQHSTNRFAAAFGCEFLKGGYSWPYETPAAWHDQAGRPVAKLARQRPTPEPES